MLSQIYLSELQKYGGKLFFECNFSEKAVDRIQLNNIFFKEILKAWCSENWKNTICSYGNEILWNNTFVKANDNTLFYTDWCNKGIMYFKDIINETDKTVESFGKLKERYSLSNNDFLKYLALLHSIPTAWKLKIKKQKFKYTNCANIDKSNT